MNTSKKANHKFKKTALGYPEIADLCTIKYDPWYVSNLLKLQHALIRRPLTMEELETDLDIQFPELSISFLANLDVNVCERTIPATKDKGNQEDIVEYWIPNCEDYDE